MARLHTNLCKIKSFELFFNLVHSIGPRLPPGTVLTMGFLDRKSLIYLAIIVALSVALIAVCIDAYASPAAAPQRDTPDDGLKCGQASVTTASGSLVDRKAFCPGELLFEDNFDTLDLDRWQHEHTLGGGGVN